MTQLILSPRALNALRLVRIAAWAGIALCAGIWAFQPDAGLADVQSPSLFKTDVATPACGCAKQQGSIT